jgi:hypothetical protein
VSLFKIPIDIEFILNFKFFRKSTSSTLKSPFKTRSHLSTIKRSITLLNKSVSKQRSNEICAIFRRLGKCSAFKRGRCYKIHDKKYVIICSNFLKNSCKDENCPLSHDVSLHKMPVCKYFLQGCCHKSQRVPISSQETNRWNKNL